MVVPGSRAVTAALSYLRSQRRRMVLVVGDEGASCGARMAESEVGGGVVAATAAGGRLSAAVRDKSGFQQAAAGDEARVAVEPALAVRRTRRAADTAGRSRRRLE